jgi:hypothetical protein
MPKFIPLSQPRRLSKIEISDLLEGNRVISNGLPKSTSLPLHAMQQQLYASEDRINSDQTNTGYDDVQQCEPDPIQPLELPYLEPRNPLPPNGSAAINSSGLFVGKSPQPDKAKQVMGLNLPKSLNHNSPRKVTADGNIAALEKEYADVFTPQLPTINGDVSEEKESMEEDRIRETAKDIYYGTELLVAFGDAARWLMSANDFNSKVRAAYMGIFDFTGLDILTAVRYTYFCSLLI